MAAASGAVVRDSAGVLITESRQPAWSAGAGWRVAPVAELEIGLEDGPDEYQFRSIAGVVRLRDGRLIVADGGASEIRLYGPTGGFLGATGGSGDGPGEYRIIHAIGPARGDSLWVYDFGLRRFTIIGADLRGSRTVGVRADLASLLAVGLTPAGLAVVRESWSSRGQTGERVPGLQRDSAAVVLLEPEGSLRDTIALVPGREVIISSEGGRAVMSAPVIARSAVAALAGDVVVVGDQAGWEFRVHGLDGVVRRIVRRTGVDLRLQPADLAAALDARLATVPPVEQPAQRLALAAMPHPTTRPAYGPVLADDAGHIWAGDWSVAGDPPRVWAVFDADGRYLGDVTMPAGFRPFHIANGLAAGVWYDDVGLERVRVYRIEQH